MKGPVNVRERADQDKRHETAVSYLAAHGEPAYWAESAVVVPDGIQIKRLTPWSQGTNPKGRVLLYPSSVFKNSLSAIYEYYVMFVLPFGSTDYSSQALLPDDMIVVTVDAGDVVRDERVVRNINMIHLAGGGGEGDERRVFDVRLDQHDSRQKPDRKDGRPGP